MRCARTWHGEGRRCRIACACRLGGRCTGGRLGASSGDCAGTGPGAPRRCGRAILTLDTCLVQRCKRRLDRLHLL
jgi:hypothetical protein